MDDHVEQELMGELRRLKSQKSLFLDDKPAQNAVHHYNSAARFDLETHHIFKAMPIALAHGSELPEPGSFLRREVAGLPLLITRGKDGAARLFINACRHRGTRLVDAQSGCQHRFSCPYHAWTYASSGALLAAPHFKDGFPGLDKNDLGLKEFPCQEAFGFIWGQLAHGAALDLYDHLGGLAVDLDALDLDKHFVAHQDTQARRANWKILVEGGIEAYHFKVAHRTTIGPHFEDSLSSYRSFGPHLRSILPRTSLAKLPEDALPKARLTDYAQVLYTLFPTTALLVQQDHIAWVQQEPISADETSVRISTLAPKAQAKKSEHWAQNHEITLTTLSEDFAIGESIQSTLRSGANEAMLFGRFEGALDVFNKTVEGYVT